MGVGTGEREGLTVGERGWATAAHMFAEICDRGNETVAFRHGVRPDSPEWTWRSLGDEARHFGLEALARGLHPGDAIAVLAKTRPEWMVADLGAIGAGLVCAGVYPTEPAQKVAYVLKDARARLAVVDTAEQVDKLLEIRDACPDLEIVVVIDPDAVPGGDPMFVSYDAWLAAGRSRAANAPQAWRQARERIRPQDCTILIYTSGTTGPPKGAMITQANIAYQVARAPALLRMQAGWTRPAYLPLCHIAERFFTYFGMAGGMISVFVDGPAAMLESLPALQPEFILGVPRVYEKLQAAAEAWVQAQPAGRRATIEAALVASAQEPAPEARDLKRAIGLGRAQMLVSGGARLPQSVSDWHRAIGAPVRNLYGLTECGTVCIDLGDTTVSGQVGHPTAFGDVTLSPEGEILVRGPHVFAGYLNLPDKTAEVLQDGWFHTGDVGRFDSEGRLLLLDRKKDIIISSSGKNITPSEVESALKASPLIADAVAVGDGRNYLTALVVIDAAAVAGALADQGEVHADFTAMARAKSTETLVRAAIEQANLGLSRPERVRDFRIVPRELVAADEVMTPTLKIKRRALLERFADLVDAMYPARLAETIG